MSGASIPYHLRPHKSVDRRLFLDLLTRYERWKPLADYIYISMGAYPLEDHKLVHRHLGISRLISFDLENDTVARQKFNRPIEKCHCICKKSAELISDFDSVLNGFSFNGQNGIIIWLDYNNPRQLGSQIREFQELLNKLCTGDVVRITVNANPNSTDDIGNLSAKPMMADDKRKKQFDNLKSRINDFLPSATSVDDMTLDRLPVVISKAFGAAALKALPATSENVFSPLSIIRYADGDQMLSMTGTVIARKDVDEMRKKIDLKSWPFASADWAKVHRLLVPALTVRERLVLERGILNKSTMELVEELGFVSAADIQMDEFLENYKNYYRFYPTLLSAEI